MYIANKEMNLKFVFLIQMAKMTGIDWARGKAKYKTREKNEESYK